MKRCKSIPAIIALLVLLNFPFSYLPLRVDAQQKGLVCYCCIGMDKKCPMISCAGPCCNAKTGVNMPRSMTEIMVPPHLEIVYLKSATYQADSIQRPDTVYLDVPDRPPES